MQSFYSSVGLLFRWSGLTPLKQAVRQLQTLLNNADFQRLKQLVAQLPLAPGLYHWRVATIAAGQDQGPFSDAQPFEHRAVPASPTPEPPALDDAGLVFRWKAPEAGQKVQFQVASDAAFAQIVLDQLTDGPQGLLPAPAPGPYFLRARTVDADGFKGNFGAAQQIDVPPPPTNWWLLLPVGLLLLML